MRARLVPEPHARLQKLRGIIHVIVVSFKPGGVPQPLKQTYKPEAELAWSAACQPPYKQFLPDSLLLVQKNLRICLEE